MAIKKLTIGMTAILACALVAAGSAVLAFQSPSRPSRAANPAPPAAQKASAKEDNAKSILANGGFERGDAQDGRSADWRKGAAVPGVQYGWDRTKAHQGRASLHLKKTAQRYLPIAQWLQEVKREGDSPRLKVVAFVKAQKTTKAILDVQFVDHDGQWTHKWVAYIGAKEAGDPPITHDWKKYEGVVAIPEGTEKLIVAAQIYGPGEVWFDDVAAEYTRAEATDPLAFHLEIRRNTILDAEAKRTTTNSATAPGSGRFSGGALGILTNSDRRRIGRPGEDPAGLRQRYRSGEAQGRRREDHTRRVGIRREAG